MAVTTETMMVGGDADASCGDPSLHEGSWTRGYSEASTSAPLDMDRQDSKASERSDLSSDLGWSPSPGRWDEQTSAKLLTEANTGTCSTLIAFLALPVLLALLALPQAIALAMSGFYLTALLAAVILPGAVARLGCVGVFLPCLYTLGAIVFLAHQIPPL